MAKPNILIIMSDEHDGRVSSPYGHPLVETPAMQRLADRGVVLENAYCNFPICVPSRSSFMTGRYASRIGVWDNAATLSSDEPTWAHRLNGLGYDTTLVGRMHFAGLDMRHGFRRHLVGEMEIGRSDPLFTWENADEVISSRAELIREAGPGEAEHQVYDDCVAARAAAYLAEPERHGGPWACCVGFMTPHFPLIVRQPYFDRYFPDRTDLPVIPPGHLERLHPHNQWMRRFMGLLDGFADEEVRRARAAYYGLVSFLDDRVGTVLRALEANGLAENTVVVYTSDHGEMAGEHGMWCKHAFFEGAVRVPMLLAWPGHVAAGRRIGQVTSLIDLVRTILDMAGDDTRDLDGVSLLDVLEGRAPESEGLAIAEFTAHGTDRPGRMVRRGRFKLNHYLDQPVELYDLERDPGEFNDLAADPAHARVREELTALVLRDWDPADIDRRVRASQRRRRIMLRGNLEPDRRWTDV